MQELSCGCTPAGIRARAGVLYYCGESSFQLNSFQNNLITQAFYPTLHLEVEEFFEACVFILFSQIGLYSVRFLAC